MVTSATSGIVVAGLRPVVTVEELAPGKRGVIATFGVNQAGNHYQANWNTASAYLDPKLTYRIHVTVQNFQMGFADVDVVATTSELKNVDTTQFVPLLNGATLPITFRIEQAALKCVGVTCSALDQCHSPGACDPFTGACSNPNKADGVPCNDGSACTLTDTCRAGACVGTNPIICAALDQCHVAGSCNPATGICSNPAAPEGTSCNDGNACTVGDSCQAGTCVGGPLASCAALDQCHLSGVCDPTTGACSNPAKPDGSPCNDGNACTQTDVCMTGACVGANQVTCVALDQCHVAGACDPTTGQCSNPVKADGTVCDDHNPCTQIDSCTAGICVGAPLCPSLAAAAARFTFGTSCTAAQLASGQTNTCYSTGTRVESQPTGSGLELRFFGPASAFPALVLEVGSGGSTFVDGSSGATLATVSVTGPGVYGVTCEGSSFSLSAGDLTACVPPPTTTAPTCASGACP